MWTIFALDAPAASSVGWRPNNDGAIGNLYVAERDERTARTIPSFVRFVRRLPEPEDLLQVEPLTGAKLDQVEMGSIQQQLAQYNLSTE